MIRGMDTILSFKTQGAQISVNRAESRATHPIDTLTTSSCKFILKKADTDAITKVIKEIISIVMLQPNVDRQLERSFGYILTAYFRLFTVFIYFNVEMNDKAICIP